MRSQMKLTLLTGVAAATLFAGVQASLAGGIAIREQSTIGLGNAFAGAAAGGAGLSSMFWNPATMTDFAGWQSSWSLSGIIPNTKITTAAGTTDGNMGKSAVLPASYTSYQFNDKLWFGLAVTAPYGSATKHPNGWGGAGQFYGLTSRIATTDINPNIAYKFNEVFSLAFGVRAMYANLHYTNAVPGGTGIINGDSWGWGFTAGLTIKPLAGTEIGIGYRSQVRLKVDGTASLPIGMSNMTATIKAPDQVTVGIKQKINDQWTVLGNFEWTRWSVFNNFPAYSTGGVLPVGLNFTNFAFRWSDGWYASLGAEYKYNPNLTLRGGLGYERSPVTNTVRGVRVPDSDRVWLTVGASYQYSQKLSFDVSYAHLFFRTAPINITSVANPAFAAVGVPFVGTARTTMDIVSVGLNYRFDEPVRGVVAKY